MMNIMYRGKNTSVPTVHRRDAPRHVSTLRVGVCRTHCVSGFVASNITCRGLSCRTLSRRGTSHTLHVGVCRIGICRKRRTKVNITTLQQHYKKTTINNQEQTRQHPLTAHCSLFSVFFPASNPQAAIISSPREARIVVIIPCDVR